MGVLTYEHDQISSIPPVRLYKSFILDADNLLPQVLPGAFKSFEILEGDGGVGTIKLISFGEESHFKSLKHRIDEIDEKNIVFKYTVIEGDILGDDLESISYVAKVEHGQHGGSVLKIASTYHAKRDEDLYRFTETEEDLHRITDKIVEGKYNGKELLKAVEAHLHAHPHAYT